MNDTPEFMTHERIMKGEEYVSYSDYLSLQRERDEAIEKHRLAVIYWQRDVFKMQRERDEAREKIKRQAERIRALEGATNYATGTPLSVAISERNDALNQLTGWENRWKAAVEMAAISENKCEELKEDIRNLEDQRDLAMKVINRLESQLSEKP